MSDENNLTRYVCRKESFGATILDRQDKWIDYISEPELQNFQQSGFLEFNGKFIKFNETRVVKNSILPNNTFSAPDNIYFEITRNCNLQCNHCFNESGVSTKNEWLWADIQRILKRAHEIGVFNIRFTGGEPLFSKNTFDALTLAKNLGLVTSLGTNGTLITPDVAKKLKQSDVKLVIVSIEGLEEIHDSIRGGGNFKRSIIGIKNLLNEAVKVRINAVAMKKNLNQMTELIKLTKELGVGLMIRRLIPVGRSNKSLMLSPSEYKELIKVINKNKIDSNVGLMTHYEPTKIKKSRIRISFHSPKCSCGDRGLDILPNGDVFACGFLAPLGDDFKAGNINEQDLFNIWLNSPVLKKQRQESINSVCRTTCPKKDVCTGSCPALLNQFNKADPYCSVMNKGK